MWARAAIGAALAGAVALGAIVTSFVSAQPSRDNADASAFSNAQQEEIQSLVRAYLLDNPEVIIEALNEFQARERAAAAQRLETGAKNNLSALLDAKGGFEAGADTTNAKVAVVEFFDYHCSFCKRANGLVRSLTKDDPSVKVVFRERPLLRDESDLAAEYALAARAQGKYVDFHFALMASTGVLTETRIKSIAKKTGLDVKALETARSDASVKQSLEETVRIASEMGADGTPAFVVATLDGAFIEVIPGYRPDEILSAIERAKKAAS